MRAVSVVLILLASVLLAGAIFEAATHAKATIADAEAWSLPALAFYTALVIVLAACCFAWGPDHELSVTSSKHSAHGASAWDHAREAISIAAQAAVSIDVLRLAAQGAFGALPWYEFDGLVLALLYILALSFEGCVVLGSSVLRLSGPAGGGSETDALARDAAEQMVSPSRHPGDLAHTDVGFSPTAGTQSGGQGQNAD